MKYSKAVNRRTFFKLAAAGSLTAAVVANFVSCLKKSDADLIAKIETSIIWKGRSGGTTWFHPRACMVPGKKSPVALMTCQAISGSDVFGKVFWSLSADNGNTWADPKPISSLGRIKLPDGKEEGTCDVVPDFHPQTRSVLAIGHNVYYQNNVLTQPYQNRFPVYVVGDIDGNWSDRKKLEWDHPDTAGIYTSGCAQRINLENGNILLPLSFGPGGTTARKVCTVLCTFDGKELKIIQSGNELDLDIKRGLLEPSLAQFDQRYFMTIRAEDGRGYLTASFDGLNWQQYQPWCWDDGEPLTMSTTQQHWITHSNGLFLVYTRKSKNNINVMRWRAPLFISRVDTRKLCLIRESEKIVFPLIGDGINDPDNVARMGNFHTVNAALDESWVTVGETLPKDNWRGNTLLGRIFWTQENKLVNL